MLNSDIAAALLVTGLVFGIALGILIADFAWSRGAGLR